MARKGKHWEYRKPKITREQISSQFHSTMAEAAETIGVAKDTLARYCKFYGIENSSFIKNLKGDDITKKEMMQCVGMSKAKARVHLGISWLVFERTLKWYNMESCFSDKHFNSYSGQGES